MRQLGGIGKALGIAALEFLLLGTICQAQEGGSSRSEERSFLLPSIVVGATRLPDISFDQSRVPADVTVITAEEIKRSGATTVQEVLAHQPGVVLFDEIGNRFNRPLTFEDSTGRLPPASQSWWTG